MPEISAFQEEKARKVKRKLNYLQFVHQKKRNGVKSTWVIQETVDLPENKSRLIDRSVNYSKTRLVIRR